MSLLPGRGYESDITKFIKDLKAKKPELDREQQKGRAIWWDKVPGDLNERRQMDQGKVPPRPYVYGTDI